MADIRRANGVAELELFSSWMVHADPWLQLGLTYDACLRSLQLPTTEVYGIWVNDTYAGFAALQTSGVFRVYVQSVFIQPSYRNQGYGALLMNHLEERGMQLSPNIFILYSSFNPDAGRLYRRLGYELVGELTDYILPGHSEFLMRKSSGPWKSFRPAGG